VARPHKKARAATNTCSERTLCGVVAATAPTNAANTKSVNPTCHHMTRPQWTSAILLPKWNEVQMKPPRATNKWPRPLPLRTRLCRGASQQVSATGLAARSRCTRWWISKSRSQPRVFRTGNKPPRGRCAAWKCKACTACTKESGRQRTKPTKTSRRFSTRAWESALGGRAGFYARNRVHAISNFCWWVATYQSGGPSNR